jgi:hypothetical protein
VREVFFFEWCPVFVWRPERLRAAWDSSWRVL